MRWLRAFFRKNLGMKLIALVLGVLTFYAIRSATSDEETIEVPVEVRVEKGVAVMAQDPLTVNITVRGSQEDIDRLDRDELKVVVHPKATDPDQPEELLTIGPRNVEGATRVRIKEVTPSVVHLTFDREASKMVAVAEPQVVGKPFRGKVDVEYEPLYVVIHGSHRGLKEIERVDTAPIDVEDRVQSFTRRVKVLQPGNTWVSKIEPPEVTVRVDIVTRLVDRVWTNVPVLAVLGPGTAPYLTISPPTVSVNLRGRADVLDGLSNRQVRVFVNCANLEVGATNTRPTVAYLPPGVDVTVDVTPREVDVIVDGRTPE